MGALDTMEVLGVRVDRVDTWEALAQIGELMEQPGASHVVTLNPEYVMWAQRDPSLLAIINNADLSVPDGMGIVWASRLAGQPLNGRVTGTGILPEICRLCARKGVGVYFLGGRPGVAELAAARLRERFPELIVAGVSASDPGPEQDPQTVADINDSGAAVVAVAYGCPKQDFWIDKNRGALTGVKVAIGVGGAFDFISGQMPRAPRWMRRMGLEWLYRLLREPKRFVRMMALPRFGWRVLADRRRKRRAVKRGAGR